MNIDTRTSLVAYSWLWLVGAGYLWGFWSDSGINILAYIGVYDIVKGAVFPLAPAVAVAAINSAVWTHNARSLPTAAENVRKIIPDKWTSRLGVAAKVLLGIAVVSLLASWGYYFWTVGRAAKVAMGLVFVGFVAHLHIAGKTDFLAKWPEIGRLTAITLICLLPGMAVKEGWDKGRKARNFALPGFSVSEAKACNSTAEERFRYVEVMGNRLFALSSKDGSICVTESTSFKLTPYRPE